MLLYVLTKSKWKQNVKQARCATQMQPLFLSSSLPFLPMSHKSTHTREKNYSCPFTILHIIWSQNIDFFFILTNQNYWIGHILRVLVLMPFPAVFVLLENVINGFILYKSEDPWLLCSIVHVHSYIELVVTKYLAVHFVLSEPLKSSSG